MATPTQTSATDLLAGLDLATVILNEVVFWSGAGISFTAPTCAAGGIELVERARKRRISPRS